MVSYYFELDNAVYGPYTLDDMKAFKVFADTPIHATYMPENRWVAAKDVSELRPYIDVSSGTAEQASFPMSEPRREQRFEPRPDPLYQPGRGQRLEPRPEPVYEPEREQRFEPRSGSAPKLKLNNDGLPKAAVFISAALAVIACFLPYVQFFISFSLWNIPVDWTAKVNLETAKFNMGLLPLFFFLLSLLEESLRGSRVGTLIFSFLASCNLFYFIFKFDVPSMARGTGYYLVIVSAILLIISGAYYAAAVKNEE